MPISYQPRSLFTCLLSVAIIYSFTAALPGQAARSYLISSTSGEALYQRGKQLYRQTKYKQAIEIWLQVLQDYQRAGDRVKESQVLSMLSFAYNNSDDYSNAVSFAKRALEIAKISKTPDLQSLSLYALCCAHSRYGRYPEAAAACEEGFRIAQQAKDSQTQAQILRALAENVYVPWAKYNDALDAYERGKALAREVRNLREEGRIYASEGFLYLKFKSYERARVAFNEALRISRANRDVEAEQQAQLGLEIINFVPSASSTEVLNDGDDAVCPNISRHEARLACLRKEGAKKQELLELRNYALSCQTGDTGCAFSSLSQALILSEEIGVREQSAQILAQIGNLLVSESKPELGISFLKQSVNIFEAIRTEARSLPADLQESYTQTVAGIYRNLADLLLRQNRVLEAQQVLDLLKIQELNNYLRNVRGYRQNLYELPAEQAILEKFGKLKISAIQAGQELSSLQTIPDANRTPAQKAQIQSLVQLQQELNQQFNQFIHSPEVENLAKQLTPAVVHQSLNPEELNGLRGKLHQINAVLLYPLVLEDRLELIITTPDSPPLHRTVNVDRITLNQKIVEFRSLLRDPNSDVKPVAQTLYNWLIKPIESELQQSNTQTIIYAPDAQLRYIPLQALHDGQQWLTQRYRINNITARSLVNFTTQPANQPHLLAGAFASGKHVFKVGTQPITLSGLPFAGKEVETLAAQLPNTKKLIDQAFSRIATTTQMNEFNIVHLATHAAFVPGTPKDSFIAFGNGEYATLADISSWTLTNVDLIVLSACDTGLGGNFGNGEEILGLGYQFQMQGAKAAIASLWTVDDGGTQALMREFYQIIKQGNVTKAEALRQAQLRLIEAGHSGMNESFKAELLKSGMDQTVVDHISHPYYWSPFILIGNGL